MVATRIDGRRVEAGMPTLHSVGHSIKRVPSTDELRLVLVLEW